MWFALPPGIHRLVIESPSLFLGDRMVELPAGEVGFLAARLERRPDVKVRLDLPERLRKTGELYLDALDLAAGRASTWWPVAAGRQ